MSKLIEVNSKESLHKALDKMIDIFKKDFQKHPTSIHICTSMIKYDEDLNEKQMYKWIPIIIYNEWFADGRIAIL